MTAMIGGTYTDFEGRSLRITGINAADTRGFPITGRITNLDGEEHNYSCTPTDFEEIWVKRRPPTTAAEQEAVRKRLGV